MDHVLLDFVDRAGFGPLGDREAHFLLGHVVTAALRHAEQRQQQVRYPLQYPDEGAEHARHDLQRPGEANRDRFGARQRDPLRHQLADHHRQGGDQDHHQHDRDLGPMRLNAGDAIQVGTEACTQGRAAEGAGQDADERYSDLHRRQERAGIVGKRQRLARPAPSLLGHLLKPDAAR